MRDAWKGENAREIEKGREREGEMEREIERARESARGGRDREIVGCEGGKGREREREM